MQNSQLKRKSYLRKKLIIQTKIGGNSGGRPNNYINSLSGGNFYT